MTFQADKFKDNGPAGREAYKQVTQADGTTVSVPYVAVDPDLGFNISVGSVNLGSSLSIQDGTTASNKAAVDASGNLSVKDANIGAKADAAWDGSASSASGISIWKYIGAKIEAVRALLAGTIAVSAASLPLPTGAATQTTVASIDTKTPALGQANMAGSRPVVIASNQSSVPVTPAATENHLGEVAGRTVTTSASFARPADATAYAAKDVVSNSTSATTLMSFAGCARINQGSGYVTKARLVTDQSTNTAQFRLWLYSVSNPTVGVDNAQFALLWANRANRIGYIDFNALSTEGTGSDSAAVVNTDVRLPFTCASSDTNLYGVLETQTAFTPTSTQNFYIELMVEQN